MLQQPTFEKLRALKLAGMADAFERQLAQPTLIASQLPIEHWHDTIGEATHADAILDRLLQNAHRLALNGESMRKTSPELTDRDRSV